MKPRPKYINSKGNTMAKPRGGRIGTRDLYSAKPTAGGPFFPVLQNEHILFNWTEETEC